MVVIPKNQASTYTHPDRMVKKKGKKVELSVPVIMHPRKGTNQTNRNGSPTGISTRLSMFKKSERKKEAEPENPKRQMLYRRGYEGGQDPKRSPPRYAMSHKTKRTKEKTSEKFIAQTGSSTSSRVPCPQS